ncbi:CC171 protein, partial [Malurus elegans]|nr:CC171 protein [Malurus elegans]
NTSGMDTVEDLRRRLQLAEQQNAELVDQHNREMAQYEKEIMKLRLELEREETVRQGLVNDLLAAKSEAHLQKHSAEDELCDAK